MSRGEMVLVDPAGERVRVVVGPVLPSWQWLVQSVGGVEDRTLGLLQVLELTGLRWPDGTPVLRWRSGAPPGGPPDRERGDRPRPGANQSGAGSPSTTQQDAGETPSMPDHARQQVGDGPAGSVGTYATTRRAGAVDEVAGGAW